MATPATQGPVTRSKQHVKTVRATRTGRADTASYRLAIGAGIDEVVAQLTQSLGASLLALITGVDRKTVLRWDQRRPRPAAEQRLRATWQIFNELVKVDDPETVRQWFMGMNPDLDDLSPAEAIAAGDHREAMLAARSFIAGG